jgi:uncharacterized alkaline shock family protein YloU
MHEQGSDLGTVKIANDVIASIAGIAALEVEGVADLSSGGGLAGEVAEILGRRDWNRGVKVEVVNQGVFIDMGVVVEYGVAIPEVTWQIQENVKQAVENMTGLNVAEVNIKIQSVRPAQEIKNNRFYGEE